MEMEDKTSSTMVLPQMEIASLRGDILLVDDDDSSISPLYVALHKLGYKVDMAFDGQQAIQKLSHSFFDLIILDWTMPGLSGGETMAHAQKVISEITLRWQSTTWCDRIASVIIFSGKEANEIKLPKCKNFRLLDHWQKPLNYPELTRRLLSGLSATGLM